MANNGLSFVEVPIFKKYLEKFEIFGFENNSLKCDCSMLDLLLGNLSPHKINQVQNIKCSGQRILLKDFKLDYCTNLESSLSIRIFAIAATLISIVLIIILLIYIYRLELKIYLYSNNLCTWYFSIDKLNANKKYDVFISYCYADEEFVINEIFQKIENDSRNFKVCIHLRDWEAGEWITTNIIKSVEESRHTLIILSNNFIKSKWGMMEFKTAHTQMVKGKNTKVIIVLYGELGKIDDLDSELKSYLKMNTYIEWGDKYFWKKLFYALSVSNNQLPSKRL